jgi:hypothetical protein
MLIDFHIRNFRSFRDEVTLSFVASTDREQRATHCMETGYSPIPRLTRAAAVFGANASGKSNLLFALSTMANLVLHSMAYGESQLADLHTPYKLDPDFAREPTEFAVNLLLDGVRYNYGFRYDARRIHSEWLTVYRTASGQHWFERNWDPVRNEETWSRWSTHFTGRKETWRQATRPQALFLTTAAQLNSDLLAPLRAWFVSGVTLLPALGPFHLEHTAVQRLEDPAFKTRVLEVLRAADLHLSDIRIEKRPGLQANLFVEPGKPPNFIAREGEIPDISFGHQIEGREPVFFDRRYESMGTQRLLAYIGPLLDAIDQGKLLVIDELDASLHPLVTRFVVGLLHDPVLSTRGAQLWLTTHDTSLLDTEVMRRDQFWIVEKDAQQVSRLVPLSDFSPRKHEALERGYLRGRYGGVPSISTPRLQ